MSCMCYKMVLRAEIEELREISAAEAYNYFKSKIGEPDYVEKTGDNVMNGMTAGTNQSSCEKESDNYFY